MDFVLEYKLYNIGDRAALKVTLDDRHSFPTQSFEIMKGLLQVCNLNVPLDCMLLIFKVRWEKIPPGANVTHSVIVRPRYPTVANHTAAQISYYPKEDAKDVRVGYSTAGGGINTGGGEFVVSRATRQKRAQIPSLSKTQIVAFIINLHQQSFDKNCFQLLKSFDCRSIDFATTSAATRQSGSRGSCSSSSACRQPRFRLRFGSITRKNTRPATRSPSSVPRPRRQKRIALSERARSSRASSDVLIVIRSLSPLLCRFVANCYAIRYVRQRKYIIYLTIVA